MRLAQNPAGLRYAIFTEEVSSREDAIFTGPFAPESIVIPPIVVDVEEAVVLEVLVEQK